MDNLEQLEKSIKACRICADNPIKSPLPHPPRPVVVLSEKARLMIVGQAPGTRVHKSGQPFTDPSGDRLRDWMGIDEATFYDRDKLAIAPMGFCFPGLDAKGGDLPPRKECAPRWQPSVMDAMPQVKLVLLIGLYAQKFYLKDRAEKRLTDTVANWQKIMNSSSNPVFFPLPHPSWRNNAWIRKNPWFSDELLPVLKDLVSKYLK